MTTASNAIKACIEDNWNAGTGGTEPTVYTSAEETMYPSEEEWIFLKTWEYEKKRKRRNDSFVKEDDYVGLRVHTRNHANKEERLDEMVTEIYRIVTPTNVTGYHKVDIIDQHRRGSDKSLSIYVADLLVELKILSTAAAAVPGSVASTATIDALLMYGAANAAWVNCIFDLESADASVLGTGQSLKTTGALDPLVTYQCPLPPLKRALKLYVSGVRIGIEDADAAAYLNQVVVRGNIYSGQTTLNNDATDYTTPQRVEQIFAAVDCSSYDNVYVGLVLASDAAGELDITFVTLRCYYAA